MWLLRYIITIELSCVVESINITAFIRGYFMSGISIAVLVIFIITYILLLVFPKLRTYIALACAIVFSILLRMGVKTIFLVAVGGSGLNVLLMIAGTMGLVVLFTESKMPQKMADILISKAPNAMWAIIMLSFFAGIISAFVDNVATVLMVAPVALAVCKKQNINPILPLVAIAVSSNLQGAATLVGDTTSILLGQEANMSFVDFFYMNVNGKGRAGIFWAVEIGAIIATMVLFIIFRKEKQKLVVAEVTKVTDYVPTLLMLLMIVLLIVVSFFEKPDYTNGIICCGLAIIGVIYESIRSKGTAIVKETVKGIDYPTLLLLFSLFIIIQGLNEAGIITKLAEIISKVGNGNPFLIYTVIVFASVLISAFVDNIPYVMTMLPVVTMLASGLGMSPYVFYFGLLIGATLGGNMTPIGASANITAIGILRKNGYEVSTAQFMKIGAPFTLVAVLSGYGLVWLFWL